jgi:hypothetical protein
MQQARLNTSTMHPSAFSFVLLQLTLAQQAAEEAAWRQQVDQVHQQLLDQQKHKAALRQRLQQDAQRAKREQLRRIEPVAKARARASGLASLGLDPEIMALSEKFGRLSGLVDEVQQRMEAQYGLYGSDWDASLGGQLPPSPATNRQQGPSRLAAGQQQLQQPMQQAPPQMGARAWPQQPRLRSQQLPQQQQQPQQQQPALQRLPQTGPGARTQQRPQQQQQVPSLQQPPVTQQQAQGGMPLRPASFQGAVPAQPQHQSAWQSSSSQPWQQPVAPPQQHEPATGHRAPV